MLLIHVLYCIVMDCFVSFTLLICSSVQEQNITLSSQIASSLIQIQILMPILSHSSTYEYHEDEDAYGAQHSKLCAARSARHFR